MRYPTSYIYRVAMYAHHVCGMKTFTSLDLYHLGRCAQQWYDSKLPFDIETERDRILAKHNWTQKKWEDEMSMTGSFYFMPSKEFTAVNRDVRAMFAPHLHIRCHARGDHFNRALINQARKRKIPVLEYVDRSKRIFVYRINPQFIDHPFFTKEAK